MYDSLLHFHSGLRWVVLILLVSSVLNAFSKWRFAKDYSRFDRLINLFTLIFFHVQATTGILLYFISPKVRFGSDTMSEPVLRFFTVEHLLMMLIAAVIITVGRKRAEKATVIASVHRKYWIWYGAALIIVLISIPWPFRELGAGWF